jgi:hypothetical protein
VGPGVLPIRRNECPSRRVPSRRLGDRRWVFFSSLNRHPGADRDRQGDGPPNTRAEGTPRFRLAGLRSQPHVAKQRSAPRALVDLPLQPPIAVGAPTRTLFSSLPPTPGGPPQTNPAASSGGRGRTEKSNSSSNGLLCRRILQNLRPVPEPLVPQLVDDLGDYIVWPKAHHEMISLFIIGGPATRSDPQERISGQAPATASGAATYCWLITRR